MAIHSYTGKLNGKRCYVVEFQSENFAAQRREGALAHRLASRICEENIPYEFRRFDHCTAHIYYEVSVEPKWEGMVERFVNELFPDESRTLRD